MLNKKILSRISSLLIIAFSLASCTQQGISIYTPKETFNTVVVCCNKINEKLKALEYPCIDVSELNFNNEQIDLIHTIEINESQNIEIEIIGTAYIDENGKEHNGEVYFYVCYYIADSMENIAFDTELFSEISNSISSTEVSPNVCNIVLESDDSCDTTIGESIDVKISNTYYLDESRTSEIKYIELTIGHKMLIYKCNL